MLRTGFLRDRGIGNKHQPLAEHPTELVPDAAHRERRLAIGEGLPYSREDGFVITGDAFNALNRNNITAVNTLGYAISGGTTLQFQDGKAGTLFGLPTQSSNSLLAQRQIQIGARLNF